MGLFGDQIYLQGIKEPEIAYIRLSKSLFPFDRELLVSEGLIYSRNKVIDKKVYLALKDALYYDPYSAELLSMYVQYANIFGNKNEALIAFNQLQQIVPNAKFLKELKQIFNH